MDAGDRSHDWGTPSPARRAYSGGLFTFSTHSLVISYCAPPLAGLLGYAPEELSGMKISGICADGNEPEHLVRALLAHHEVFDCPLALVRQDKTCFDTRIDAYALSGSCAVCMVTVPSAMEAALLDGQQILLDSISTQIWYLTDAETYGAVNRAHADFYGMQKSDLVGKRLSNLLRTEEAAVCIEGNLKVFLEKRPIRSEEWVCNVSGEARLLAIAKNPRLNDAGEVEYVVCSAEDITELRRAESQARENEQRFSSLIDMMPDATLILDWDGSILYANAAAARLAGLAHPKDLNGRNPVEFIHPDFRQSLLDDLAEVRSGQGGKLAHYLGRDVNGVEKWLEGLGTAIRFGGRTADLVTLRDITERKSVEGELARSNQRYRDLYRLMRMMCDNVPDMIWAKDMDRRFIFANRAICERLLHAADTDEPLGKTDLFFASRERNTHPDDPDWHTFGEICRDSDAAVMESRMPDRFDEFGNVRGEFIFLDVYKAPFLDGEGSLIGIVGCGRDVTGERGTGEHLRRREAILDAVSFAADRFLRGAFWKEQMPAVLERLGTATDVSRVYIFENAVDPGTGNFVCSQRWEWTADGVSVQIDNPDLQCVPYRDIPRWYHELSAGRPIAGLVSEFPESERAYLEPQEIRSLVAVPIFVHGHFWGFAGFDEIRMERTWPTSEIDALAAAATIIGSAILRTMSEEMYRNPVERSPIGIYLVQDDRLKYFNPGFAGIFGFTRDEIAAGSSYIDLIHPDEHIRVSGRLSALLSGTAETGFLECRGIRRDGTAVFLENYVSRTSFEGRPAIVGSLIDVTERRRAEEELKSSEERLKILFEYAPDAYFLIDMEGIFVDENRAAEQLSGYAKEELVGKNLAEIGLLPPDQFQKAVAIVERIVSGGSAEPVELGLIVKDGRPVAAEISMYPVTIGGQPLVLGIARDITERKKLEELNRTAFGMIDTNMEQMAILNDQIRNPLQVIIALASMEGGTIHEKILNQAFEINSIITLLDRGWLYSGKVREYLRKHYEIGNGN